MSAPVRATDAATVRIPANVGLFLNGARKAVLAVDLLPSGLAARVVAVRDGAAVTENFVVGFPPRVTFIREVHATESVRPTATVQVTRS